MRDLSAFQDAFERALDGDERGLAPWLAGGPADAEGLKVYRNTVAKGRLDALAANSPAAAAADPAGFAALALTHGRERPPARPSLMLYGEDFPDRLAAAGETALADLARLDRLWLEALFAADAPAASGGDFAALSPEDFAGTVAPPHPGVRFAWFGGDVVARWRRLRGAATAISSEDEAGGVLFVRIDGDIESLALDRAGFAFLDACRSGVPLGAAAEAALAAAPRADLQTVFARLITAGAFAALDRPPPAKGPRP